MSKLSGPARDYNILLYTIRNGKQHPFLGKSDREATLVLRAGGVLTTYGSPPLKRGVMLGLDLSTEVDFTERTTRKTALKLSTINYL